MRLLVLFIQKATTQAYHVDVQEVDSVLNLSAVESIWEVNCLVTILLMTMMQYYCMAVPLRCVDMTASLAMPAAMSAAMPVAMSVNMTVTTTMHMTLTMSMTMHINITTVIVTMTVTVTVIV